ncbi:MAG: glycosyltransferase family 4 protein [Candidatus Aureabacteria bacterium]|nr:glycosyltransferase family 4 protein [Candidatus Auribacterota bacterium]
MSYKILFKKDGHVGLAQLIKLRFKSLFSKKIKIGFGTVYLRSTTATRRFHIDPIIDYINKYSEKYTCDMFLKKDCLSRFNILIIVKDFAHIDYQKIIDLKKKNKLLIYRITDSKSEMYQDGNNELKQQIALMDGVIVPNPLTQKDIESVNTNIRLIEAPMITYKYKKNYESDGVVKILWEGYKENLESMKRVHSILEKLNKNLSCKFNLIYHSDISSKDEGLIKYIKWELSNWENMLISSDIAVVIKPIEDKYQQRKPSTKINTYRLAGLPVVCTPSEADKMVIEHGKTGFFAYTDDDWYEYLKKLIENAALRKEIGRAGRQYVIENFSIDRISRKYMDFFDKLVRDNNFIK